MSEALTIQHESNGSGGRYFAGLGDGFEAEMTYRIRADGARVIDHTGVPRPFEGKGYALQLVKRAIADARRDDFKIVPLCPYVEAQFRRHSEWEDLRAR
ncbi:GNAT family N-acetyltransferase [Pelagibacterium xiamenense]|uniref:GNAT family N-acetyltransferase n=1 Tax=Pelagibacterium xiamenense TaxID=2901140 RepID=UPI001E324511|nr:GNAT family N-acetyltransferase [Pelagibacterium xiamenense]MCD7060567.1 N-acetyltransferase [Pelagibacterium xiamenense]